MALEGITDASPSEVVVTVGSQQGLDLVTRVFVDPGDVILAEGPSYVGALGVFQAAEARVRHVAMDDDGLIPEALEEALVDCRANGDRVKFLYTVPNFHNPAGVTLSEPRREAIIALAEKHDLLVIEDNPYGLLGFEREPLRALRARNSQRVIYLGSFSKTFSPGLRVGWVLAPLAVREKLVLATEAQVLCPPSLTQYAVARYLDTQPWREQIKLFTELYRERRDATLESLAALMPAGTTWTRPDGGFYVWLKLPHGLDAKLMQPRAVNAHVAYVPGIGFYADGNGREYMRLSYCYPEPDQIREGVRRLARVIEAELDLHSTFDRVDTGTFRAVRPGATTPDASSARPTATPTRTADERDRPAPAPRDRDRAAPAARRRPRRRPDLRARGQPLLGHPGVGGAASAPASTPSSGTPTPSLLPGLAASPADAVFIALHGATGEDGALRAVLDLAGVPYVGSPAAACRLAWDKPAAKSVVRSAGRHDAGLGGAAAQHVPRARRRRGARPDRRPARPAADGEAGQRRLGPGRAEGQPGRGPARRDGQLLRLRRHRAWSSGSSRAWSSRCRSIDLGDGPGGAAGRRDRPRVRRLRLHRRATRRASPSTTRRPGCRDDVAARAAALAVRVHEVLGLADLSRTDAIVASGRRGALPRGERLPGTHRDVDVPDGRRGRRLRARRGPRPAARPPGRESSADVTPTPLRP